MDYIRRFYAYSSNFCRSVIEWRSPFTVVYVLAVNAIFWSIVFYTSHETQAECLLGIAATIVFWDILLSPTHNRSVASQICYWPIQDLFRTTAFVTAMAATRQLKMNEEEQAFWLASSSVTCLLIGPVYKYNQITAKIGKFFRGIFDFFSYLLYLLIINPTKKTYEALKYIFLLKWIPGNSLWQYLRSFGSSVYKFIDDWFLHYFRVMGNRTLEFFQYWIYFQWWKDLRAWGSKNIYAPLAKKFAIAWDGFVYVFGGYWMLPVLQFCGRQVKKAGFIALGYLNQLAIIIGNSVLWPVAVICFEQLKAGYLIFHAAAVQPIIDVVYLKYKHVEDLTFIHVLGPVCQKVIDHVPEKNPFADDSESELQEFIPDASEAASDSEFSTLSAPETDDEEHAFAKVLKKIAISDSESDNEELSLHHRRSRNVIKK